MPRGRRRTQYVRDNSGRFASTPGGGPSKSSPAAVRKAAKAAAMKGGSLAARSSLKRSKAKLAASPSPQQKGAVTRGQRVARAAIKASKTKIASTAGSKLRKAVAGSLSILAVKNRLAAKNKQVKSKAVKPKPVKTKQSTKKAKSVEQEKPVALKSRSTASSKKAISNQVPKKKSQPEAVSQSRKINLAAERAKKMASRTGVVPGSKFESGQSVKTMSLKDMRSAVIKSVKGSGKSGMAMIASEAGTGTGVSSIKSGRMPKTRGEWEKAYRALVSMPMSERGRKERPGIVNGVDIHKSFKPWAVFKLDPKTATKQDVDAAFRNVAKKVHPDVGGRRKDFERVKKMRDSVMALMKTTPAKTKAKKSKSTKKTTTKPSGPRLLPPSRY
jgi:hypothetical protein